MPNSDKFIPTHKSITLHTKGEPVACIVDNDSQNEFRYNSILNDSSIQVSLIGFLNKHEDLGLLMGFKLKMKTDAEFFEYTVYPDSEFIDTVIFNESIFIINEKLENLYFLKKIVTDQFVKTKTEFDKFQKMIN